MTGVKKKILEILSKFENANLASEAAREVIADRLIKHITDKKES